MCFAARAPSPRKPGKGGWTAPAKVHATYVLVGAGTASFFAMRGIREADPSAKILIIGAEKEAPYMRTPLSKELWFQKGSGKGGAGGGDDEAPAFNQDGTIASRAAYPPPVSGNGQKGRARRVCVVLDLRGRNHWRGQAHACAPPGPVSGRGHA